LIHGELEVKKNLLLIFLIAFMTSCAPKTTETPAALTPVNVCYSALAGTQAVAWYAYEKGIFQKYGLKVNLVSITGGSAAVSTLVSGDMDICQVAATSVVNAVVAHKDVVIIAGLINIVSGSLIAQPGITSMAMLHGKIIGTQIGSNTDSVTRLVLKTQSIDPDKDVVLLNIGGEPQRAAALEARKIDATFIIPPLTLEMRNKGYVELFNADAAQIPYQATSIATTRNFLVKNPAVVTDFMKGILEAIVRIKHDPAGSEAIIAKYLTLDPVADAAILQETYTSVLLGTLENVPYPTLNGLQTVIDTTAQQNPGAALIKPQNMVDTSTLDALKSSGFISGLK
jgi:NitT/TauT family transport system substrate-binding protein